MTGFRHLLNTWVTPGSGVAEVILIFGSLTFVIVVVFLWVALVRTPRKRRHLYHHHHAPSAVGLPEAPAEPQSSRGVHLFRRRRHRRHHRTERPLNPTLAQAGGLPPPRPEDQPPAI